MNGSPILALLPVLTFFLLYSLILGSGPGAEQGWRRSFVLAAVAWAVYLALTSEALSLVRGLTLPWVALVWFVPCVALAARAWRLRAPQRAAALLRDGINNLARGERVVLAGMVGICGVLLGVALIAPPNTYDSALYHMARVVHWQQNASLRPYPAIIEHQLHKPIWAETAILHLRMLWGNDRPANLVQWFSMLGSVVVASGIAARLGGGRRAQMLAAAFAISIPMGVLQATSTQNDYVAAFWAAILAFLVVLAVTRDLSRWEFAALAAAVGLGALSKGTFFVYGPPFVAWFLLHRLLRRGFRRAVGAGVGIAVVAILLNAGFWVRNIQVYGGPYGSSTWFQQNLWVRLLEEPSATPGEEGGALPIVPAGEPAAATSPDEAPSAAPLIVYLARLAQTAGRNLTLPTGFLNRPAIAAVESLPGVFGEAYADELRAVSWNHEDFAGNPVHLLLTLTSLPLLLPLWRRPGERVALAYAGVTLLTYALIPIVIGHGPSIFGIRYQLSFFVLGAPIFGVALGRVAGDRLSRFAAAGLLVLAAPWVLLNKTRPVIGMPPWRTVIGSILVEEQETVLLPWNPGLRDDYQMATEAVLESGCTEVGLRANAAFLEYPLWWLLDAPQNGIRVESLESTSYLAPYADATFRPCAVICANCDQETSLRGLPLFGTFDSMKVYLEE